MFQMGGLPKPFIEQTQMFAETALMVREPALEIINNLKSTDFQKPAVRYLLCIFLIFTIGSIHNRHTGFLQLHFKLLWYKND